VTPRFLCQNPAILGQIFRGSAPTLPSFRWYRRLMSFSSERPSSNDTFTLSRSPLDHLTPLPPSSLNIIFHCFCVARSVFFRHLFFFLPTAPLFLPPLKFLSILLLSQSSVEGKYSLRLSFPCFYHPSGFFFCSPGSFPPCRALSQAGSLLPLV